MGKKSATVPDAWDDDWESQADREEEKESDIASPEPAKKSSTAERLAKHAESNKQLWDSAESPSTFHYLAAREDVPLKTEFKPTLKVLSRKPAKKVAKYDPVTGLMQMTFEDDDENEEEKNTPQLSAEERRLKAQREREEKQKKYEEARARLFGTPVATRSGSSSPGSRTPPQVSVDSRGGKNSARSRGSNRQEHRRPESGTKELYDPNYTVKPGTVSIQKRATDSTSTGRSVSREDDQVIRAPRGPEGSGRGFGTSNTNGRTG